MSLKKDKNYFGKEVEDAIVLYSQVDNQFVKDRLFNLVIYPALNKLAENVIHDRKFYNTGNDSYIDIKHDLVVYLHDRLHKFDPSTEKKAFSYFNRISINWVFGKMREVGNETYGKVEIEEIDEERDLDMEVYHNEYTDELREFCQKWAKWGNNYLNYFYFIRDDKIVPFSETDKKIANAIFNLFENSHSIDIYHKKSLYILIREQVGCRTPRMTDVIKVLKPLCYQMYLDYRDTGSTQYWHRYLYYPEKYTDEDIYV